MRSHPGRFGSVIAGITFIDDRVIASGDTALVMKTLSLPSSYLGKSVTVLVEVIRAAMRSKLEVRLNGVLVSVILPTDDTVERTTLRLPSSRSVIALVGTNVTIGRVELIGA